MTTKLKSCPFCGSENVFVVKDFWVDSHWKPKCGDCGATFDTAMETKKAAAKKWNGRIL